MGSEQDGSLSCINVSAGGLVWVRRRNGSWWPGRTVGLHEMPAKCPLPPRSGTPIKLLGREDGSMDWYNLEKSTRVKAFRCGEFDECIRKAVASAVRPNKCSTSTGKYVRREDAILHALEIEKAYFPARKQNGSGMNNSFRTTGYDFTKKKMHGLDKQSGYMARKFNILEEKSTQVVPQSSVSYEQPNKLIAADVQLMEKKRWKTPNDSEDNEGIKRMRNLQEIGVGLVSTRKPNMHVDMELSTELALPDSAFISESDIDNDFSSLSPIKSSNPGSSMKRKRSNVAQAHEYVRRKNRRRALSKVCDGSRVIIPSYCHWDGTFGGESSLRGATQKKSNVPLSTPRWTNISCGTIDSPHFSGTSSQTLLGACENTCKFDGTEFDFEVKDSELASMLEFIDDDCSDGLVDVPLVMGDTISEVPDFPKTSNYCPTRKIQPHVAEKQCNCCSQDDLVSHVSEGLGECSFTDSRYRFNNVRKKEEKKTLERHSSSKKNLNSIKFTKIALSDSYLNEAAQSDSSLKDDSMQKERCSAGLTNKIDSNSFGESSTPDIRHHVVKDESVSDVHHIPQSQSSELPCFSSEQGHCQSEVRRHGVKNHSSSLVDSRDRGKTSKRHMPISTLLTQQLFPHDHESLLTCSKLRVLTQLRSTGVNSLLYDVELTVETSSRRPHVPLISLMSKLNGKAIVGHPVPVEVMEDGSSDMLSTKTDCWPATSNIDRPLKNGGEIFGRAMPKKKAGQTYLSVQWGNHDHVNFTSLWKRKYLNGRKSRLSPRKIRRLSSISVDCKERGEERKPVVEKMVGPAVACVPLRLVFSRIIEALSCSARLTSIS